MPTQELNELWCEYLALSKADRKLFDACKQSGGEWLFSGPAWETYLAASQKTHAAWARFYAAYMNHHAEAVMEVQP